MTNRLHKKMIESLMSHIVDITIKIQLTFFFLRQAGSLERPRPQTPQPCLHRSQILEVLSARDPEHTGVIQTSAPPPGGPWGDQRHPCMFAEPPLGECVLSPTAAAVSLYDVVWWFFLRSSIKYQIRDRPCSMPIKCVCVASVTWRAVSANTTHSVQISPISHKTYSMSSDRRKTDKIKRRKRAELLIPFVCVCVCCVSVCVV